LEKTGEVIGIVTNFFLPETKYSNKFSCSLKKCWFATRIDHLSEEKLIRLNMHYYKHELKRFFALKRSNTLGNTIVKDINGKVVYRNANVVYHLKKLDLHRYKDSRRMSMIGRKWNNLLSGEAFGGSFHIVLNQIKDLISAPAENIKQRPSRFLFLNQKYYTMLKTNEKIIRELEKIDKYLEGKKRLK
jgi:hypothetical protein